MIREMAESGRRSEVRRLSLVTHSGKACEGDVTISVLRAGRLAEYCTAVSNLRQSSGQDSLTETDAQFALDLFVHEVANLSAAASALISAVRLPKNSSTWRHIRGLEQLIRSMEELSRRVKSLGAAENHCELIDVGEVIDELLVIIGPSLRAIQARATVCLQPQLSAHAGRSGVLQVLLNLATNAVRALSSVPVREFHIHGGRRGDKTWITFSNPGKEIPKADSLFSPFKHEAEGTGLGLYISRGIARTFAGDITYEYSGGQNRFRLILPATGSESQT